MPNEIISSVTEPPDPTARGMGQIVYTLLQDAIAVAGAGKNEYDPTIVNAVCRYAPAKYPGAFPEINITLDRWNKAFKLTVTETTREVFGGSL